MKSKLNRIDWQSICDFQKYLNDQKQSLASSYKVQKYILRNAAQENLHCGFGSRTLQRKELINFLWHAFNTTMLDKHMFIIGCSLFHFKSSKCGTLAKWFVMMGRFLLKDLCPCIILVLVSLGFFYLKNIWKLQVMIWIQNWILCRRLIIFLKLTKCIGKILSNKTHNYSQLKKAKSLQIQK